MYMELMVGSHLPHVDDFPTWHFLWIINNNFRNREFEPDNIMFQNEVFCLKPNVTPNFRGIYD